MFNQLTNYLLQHKRVAIPSVGTVHLLQRPARLSVADRIILPPSYAIELKDDDNVSEHQLHFLSSRLHQDEESVQQELNNFGLRLKDELREGFEWKGIGCLYQRNSSMDASLQLFQPVAAERIMRQEAEHPVLVGDQRIISSRAAEVKVEDEAAPNQLSIITVGWVILILAILYILFVLWQGNFRVETTGSKSAPTSVVQYGRFRLQSQTLNPLLRTFHGVQAKRQPSFTF